MVKIRLSRVGTRNKPFYRIVVTDSRNARDGKFIEQIGFFSSIPIEFKRTFIDLDRISYWIDRGAVFSSRVYSLIKKYKNEIE